MIINRIYKKQSTYCRYTNNGEKIKEGDILGYGDNYPCVVLYNTWEARFEAVEFGYLKDDGYTFRANDIISQTVPWEILGNIDDNFKLLNEVPEDFNYNKYLEKYYNKKI